MKKKILGYICAFLVMVPCFMFTACGKPDDATPPTAPSPVVTTPEVTMSSMSTEMINDSFEDEYNSVTKTFTIEYGGELPSVEDFEIVANFSNGTTSVVENINVVCPIEFYENNLVVRDEPYKFELVTNDAVAGKIVEFFVKIVKKKVALPAVKPNQSFVYDETEKTLELVGFDDNVMSVTGNIGINAGEYTAIVTLVDTANYEWLDGGDVSFDWVIERAELDKPEIIGSYVYNSAEQTAVIDYKGYTKELFVVSGNNAVNAGVHNVEIVLADSDNYKWKDTDELSFAIDWVIAKKSVEFAELPSIVDEYVFVGEPVSVVFDEKFDESFMKVLNGTQTNAGEFKVRIYLDDNHKFADESLNVIGYYELDWIITEPETEILMVDLSGYDIDDWTGTFNMVVGADVKTISLSGLPEQVSVIYSHTKDGASVTADQLDTMATYITTATITLKSEYADAYVLPTEADYECIPKVSNNRYESIVIKESAIEISFTWKIYTKEVDISSYYSWSGDMQYDAEEIDTLPTVVLLKYAQAFSFAYVYYKYDDTLKIFVEISDVPSEVGKYKVTARVVTEKYFLTHTIINDFEFEIV